MTRLNRQRRVLLTAAAVIAVVTTACGVVGTRGEGAVATEARETQGFSRVESGAGIHVSVRIGAKAPIEVRAQGNILPLIVTEVADGTLRIGSSKGFTTSEKIEVSLTTPALEGMVLSGGSRGRIDGLSSDALDVDLAGGSVLSASGTAGNLSLAVSGGSVAELDGLTAATVEVDLSGGSRADVSATDSVRGSAAGGSRVHVAGGAATAVDATDGSQVERR